MYNRNTFNDNKIWINDKFLNIRFTQVVNIIAIYNKNIKIDIKKENKAKIGKNYHK